MENRAQSKWTSDDSYAIALITLMAAGISLTAWLAKRFPEESASLHKAAIHTTYKEKTR